MKKTLNILLLILAPSLLHAQCFTSSGNPVGGSSNMGVLDKKVLSIVGFYRYAYSDRFYEGSKISTIGLIDNARFNFLGTLIAYGITDRLNLEAEAGYFLSKKKTYAIPAGYALNGFGLSNAVISGKYQIYFNPDKKIEFSLAAGIKVPFSLESKSVGNVRLPYDLQPSTSTVGAVLQAYLIKEHSYSGMRYFLYSRAETNATSRDGYRMGNVWTNSIFVSRHLIRTSNWPVTVTLILQLRNENRGRSYISSEVESASGSIKFLLAPQVNLSFRNQMNLSLISDFPVYQYYNNAQIADKISFAIVLNQPLTL
jgi:hypothetical protein